MRLFLDEDAAAANLTELLRSAGHDVATIADTDSHGESDVLQMTNAIRLCRAIVTRNHDDYEELNDLIHICGGQHFEILVIRRENNRARDMTARRTVIAIRNLMAAGLAIEDQIHVLNHFR